MTKRPADRKPRGENLLEDLSQELGGNPEEETQLPDESTLLQVPFPGTTAGAPPAPSRPASPPVRVVGQYRLGEQVGGGGMGVIYKAEDTRLGRTVALKLLPPELARDRTAKTRFLQEARAASALDHPNLCTIYDAGEIDGQLYLAMPLYEGETLRDRLAHGPLPVEEAVDIARQVAQGLAKAHRQGIVHRDVKPANLMLTTDGVVKILDFGIAKLAGEAGITRTGVSIGTPAYMSPEQARGAAVDHRTDLWSLGVVLYEMLTGRRPFTGDHEQIVFQAILNREPEPLARLRPDAPVELERMIAGLLAKDPEKRAYPTADALSAELRKLQGGSQATLQTQMTVAAASRGRTVRLWMLGVLALAALLAALGFLLRTGGRAKEGSEAPPRATFTQVTDLAGSELFPSLHPDGDFLVYVKSAEGNADIYLQRAGGGNPINLTQGSPENDTQPAYSPDGQQIAFRSERDGGGIFVMGATGESVRRLANFGYNPAWSPDGKEILCATEGVFDPATRRHHSELWRIDAATGGRRKVALAEDAVQPSWSPNGLRIAFWSWSPATAQRSVWTATPDGSGAVRVTDDSSLNWNPVWSPDGKHLYFASDRSGSMNLWRVPIDERTGKALGRPEPITTPSQWAGFISLARGGGRLVYVTDVSEANLGRAAFDPGRAEVVGALQPVTQGSRSVRSGSISPDGQWVAYDTWIPESDLFLVRPDGSEVRRLTQDAHKDRVPFWSPDGSRILFYSNRSGKYEAWTIRPDGSELQQVTQAREPLFNPFWSPDGTRIVASLGALGTPVVLDLTKPLSQRVPQPIAAGGEEDSFAVYSWSPDGKRLAGFDDEQSEVMVYSFATRKLERMGQSGHWPTWTSDGRQLLFLREGRIYALDLHTRKAREVLAPPQNASFSFLALSPDSRTLLTVLATEERNLWMATME
ncbi:MAG TPA: protein kinase [Thermoanaerobaculia bacterium]